MNILILSCGTRNKIIQYFKQEIGMAGEVIATDCWELAPALYEADQYFVVPNINAAEYLECILKICKKESISGIFSLIDPELNLLAKNKKKFNDLGVTVFVSDYDIVDTCFDKGKMFDFCERNHINTVPTYKNLIEFISAYEKKMVVFPVFVKPANGSCSKLAQRVDDIDSLKLLCENNHGLVIQKLMTGQEYGIDVYTDLLSKEIVSIFIKKKILMRAGETDKSVSIVREDIYEFIKNFVMRLGTIGPIDIDLFEQDGELYISEVNPRFGGGYPHAYECGVNFPKLMINNLNKRENRVIIGEYKEDTYMMKYLEVKMFDMKKQVLYDR